jgi:hypothetical protein
MPRPRFHLRSLFILTAIVAVGCLVGRVVLGIFTNRIPIHIYRRWDQSGQTTLRTYFDGVTTIEETVGSGPLVDDVPQSAAPDRASPPNR